jgi:aspartyl-tRNA(Asn)/glutamyl-tRNA(Gln) amidotransferase subunit A
MLDKMKAYMQAAPHTRRSFLAAASATVFKPAFGATQDLTALTLKQTGDLLRRKGTSPVELTEACLKRIERYNPAVNAFITITGEQALKTAREMQTEQQRGKWRGPLHGIPIALKDNIDTAGVRTTAASGVFKDRVPTEDAGVVRRLKEAGAVLVGKLNMHEFAYGGTSDVTYFGAVHNPWALDHIAGGSSGGSAAAMAADLCFGTLGTDTAGSVRMPSAYCGVVGFKPTYGRVSIRGIIPLSWSLDHCGPISKTVEDAGLILQVIAGYDEMDPTTVNASVPDYGRALQMPVAKLRLGLPRPTFFEGLNAEVARAVETAIGVLRKMTQSVTDAKLPSLPAALPIVGAEAYAYHAKWIAESPGLYQPFTRDRIIAFAAGVKAPEYADALHQTQVLRREITKSFASVDLLITPTMIGPAESLADTKDFDPKGIRNTSPFNILGLPAISLPCGFTDAGLPIGLQISGAPWAEGAVLALAQAYERETEWHKRRPKLT